MRRVGSRDIAAGTGLFSTTTGWPSASDSPCAITRDCTSALPPAGKGTMRVSGRVGRSSARAMPNSGTAARRMARKNRWRMFGNEARCISYC